MEFAEHNSGKVNLFTLGCHKIHALRQAFSIVYI
jgi:hypothetical protein